MTGQPVLEPPWTMLKMPYAVLILLDLQDVTIIECPADDVGLCAGTLDIVRALDRRPELAKVLELDVVPNVRERCADDCRLLDGGAGGNA